MPNAVAGIVVGKIGAIGAVGLAQQGQVFLHLGAGHIQQRTDDVAPDAGDAAQPVQTGAPYQVHQHRFNGIIQGVGGGDAPPLPCRFGKESITGVAAGFLHRKVVFQRQGGGINMADSIGQSQLPGQLPHKLLVPVGFSAAQPVVNVADDQLPAVFLPQDSQKA